MLMEISFESETPIYMQIYQQILKGVSKGEVADGEELPSVRQLSSDIGVDKNTVNKAYNLLKRQGVIVTHRRKGAVVTRQQERPLTEELQQKLETELEVLIATGLCHQLSKGEMMAWFEKILDRF